LSALPQLEKLNVTGEDLKRSERYVAKQKISDAAKQFENREDFLKSLDMELSFYAYNSDNQARTLQLIAKTNQFNMTTRRHKQSDLSALIDSGAVVVPIGLSDKFSTKETIGVVVLRPLDSKTLEVETFVLSCRVLGRDVEKGIMHWVHQYAKAHKFSYVQGLFEPTDRNLAAVKLYPELGYKALTAGRTYQLDLQKYKELTLEHVQVGEDEYATK
jgi:FkbH-like protein